MPSRVGPIKPVSGQKMPCKLRLKIANECNNILTKAKLSPSNRSYQYYLIHSKDIQENLLDRLFRLFESLMRTMYEKSSWGWNEVEKLSEWKHSRTRFLVVTKNDLESDQSDIIHVNENPPSEQGVIGFMCFRYEIGADKNECVLYVYELHIDPEYQRQGLGEDLMLMARCLAVGFKMDKIMLTVFRTNDIALKFYNKLNFKPDKSSPGKDEADYLILSSKV